MWFLLPLVILAPKVDLVKADRLLQQARYDEALTALGTTCEGEGLNIADCERVRAFILKALGKDAEAKASFERMIVAQPGITLSEDVPPKLRSLYLDAKQAIQATQELELQPVVIVDDGKRWKLELREPTETHYHNVVIFIKPHGFERFSQVELVKDEKIWSGNFVPEKEVDATNTNYYAVLLLASGAEVGIGTAMQTRVLNVSKVEEPKGVGSDALGVRSKSKDDRILGFPKWPFVAVVGGGLVAVAVGVTLAILLTRSDEPGAVHVGIQFQDD